MKEIIILLGHGSPEKYAKKVLLALRKKLRAKLSRNKYNLYYAFLQFNKPSLTSCLHKMFNSTFDIRHSKILIVPVFLSNGRHLMYDVPKIIKKIKLKCVKHKKLNIKIALPLGSDDLIVELLNKRIER